ncbi:hypothetical protein CCC_00957 [Paramagnetospirillum magnetotacticum MS-1]|uniref:PEGA domain-containing protein n=1 Tax=Paramagnetospirillum magnetotacticum MS-1 TaxID=272627 RepID=A0A0C2UYJ7_PARME|nr:hypothetical protein [Paramagnetospirillum magnetotacticum]KIL97896.1 hypothetical protein CCC_00957 [Paramagnetospirillum magnetotacticum MS-1]
MRRLLSVLAMAAMVAACAPAERTETVDDRPSLEVVGAVSGARLFIDGLDMGVVDQPLLLEPGTHVVKVVGPKGGIYTEKVFVSGRGLRKLAVPAGAAQ